MAFPHKATPTAVGTLNLALPGNEVGREIEVE